jgi:ferredoxin-NADP reductase
MKIYPVKIIASKKVTHDTLRIVTDKPKGYKFKPGQATEVTIDKIGWRRKRNPFTFTNLPDDDHLEFTIKTYPLHKCVTNELLKLKKGDALILHDVFGAISYKGVGVFIAGGAGVTPFISILRDLRIKNMIKGNLLVFANKTKADIINESEFKKMLGKAFINILSDEKVKGCFHGMITEDFLKANITDFNQQFYVCGPPPMITAVIKQLKMLGVEKKSIITEGI